MNSRIIILSIVLLIYFISEVYIIANLKQVIPGAKYSSIYWGIYAFSIVLLIFSIIYTYNHYGNANVGISIPTPTSNFWIGMMFALIVTKLIFTIILLLVDGSRFIFWLGDQVASLFGSDKGTISLEGRRNFLIKVGLGLAAIPFASFLYGITKGKYQYTVRKTALKFPNLPKVFDGYKVVQISDIHSGSFDSKEQVLKGVQMINDLNPDLILFTGDLVNDRASEIEPFLDVFKQLKAKDGIFSITGNHDYGDYTAWPSSDAKKENFRQLIERHGDMGFKILMNENVKIRKGEDHFNLVGIENWGLPPFPQKGDLNRALHGVDEKFTLLMSHDPSHWDAEVLKHNNQVDLTLSGHTHGMQFGIEIPGFKWSPVKFKYPRWAGLYQEKDKYLYVNRGFGFIGLPGRVGIWPEITLLELYSA